MTTPATETAPQVPVSRLTPGQWKQEPKTPKRKAVPVTTQILDQVWRKSSRSNNNGACVEVRRMDDTVHVRNSKRPDEAKVLFTLLEWDAFREGVALGEFRTA